MTYEQIPTNDPRLGRNINHDPRSRLFPFRAAKDVELVSTRHQINIDVLDQGSLGSCTGNTGTYAMGANPFWPTLEEEVQNALDQEYAKQLYSDATAIDPFTGQWPPTDTGSDGLSIAKVLKRRGLISGYRWAFSLHDMKAALLETPVMLGIGWYTSFYRPDSNGNVRITSTATVNGGHEIIVDELDMENERFGLTNSWGRDYGLDGRFYISFADMQRLLDERGDVVVLVPNSLPEPQPEPEPEKPEPEPNPEPVVPSPSNPGCFLGLFTSLFNR